MRPHREYDRVLSISGTIPKRQRAVKKRGLAADAFSALVVQVLKLAAVLETAGNDLARPVQQSAARWQVLAAIEHEPLSVAAVARVLAHTRQSVQRIADLVVTDGLARYTPNPAHRRAKLLDLTPAGRRTLRTIQVAQAEWAQQIAEELAPVELDSARDTLAELERRIEAWTATQNPDDDR